MVYVPAKKSDDGVVKVIYTSKDRKISMGLARQVGNTYSRKI